MGNILDFLRSKKETASVPAAPAVPAAPSPDEYHCSGTCQWPGCRHKKYRPSLCKYRGPVLEA